MARRAVPLASLPDRDRLRAARALNRYWGITSTDLRREGYRFTDRQLLDPLMDPIDDEVAIARALAGERAVWDNLTHYERLRVRFLIRVRMDATGSGLADWCRSVGEDFLTVQRYILRSRAADREKATDG